MHSVINRIEQKISSKAIQLLPRIDDTEIRSFEEAFQLQLPEDYTFFLTEIGAGFEKAGRFLTPKDWQESFWTPPSSHNPFQSPCMIKHEHEFETIWLEFIKDPEKEAIWNKGHWDPMYGTIAIGEIGCGLYYRLILNGPLKNNVFVWGDHAFNPPKFLDQVGYLNWVEFQIDAYF